MNAQLFLTLSTFVAIVMPPTIDTWLATKIKQAQLLVLATIAVGAICASLGGALTQLAAGGITATQFWTLVANGAAAGTLTGIYNYWKASRPTSTPTDPTPTPAPAPDPTPPTGPSAS